jgi:IMP dehydrogenase
VKQDPEKFAGEGLTYDDVLLLPAYSEVLPREADISSQFTRNIPINTPVISAAMDTVTEYKMAIAIAGEGGIGVLHKNMTIKQQAEQVRRVKRYESGMIQDPLTLPATAKVADALKLMRDHKIGGIPVIDENHRLVGIVTNRDLRFEKSPSRSISEVMTKENVVTAKKGTDLRRAEQMLQKYKIEKLPVVDENNKLVGLITYKDIQKIHLHPHACKDEFGRLRVAAALGITADMHERAAALIHAGVDAVVIDTAHGHSKKVLEEVKNFKKKFALDVVAGNVATAEAALALAKAGADSVKVGIGPGSICTTRIIAGIGVPQLTAVYEVAKALKGSDIPIIADGGIRYTGDVVKAIAAGASTVMAGSLFAGVEESPGETIIYEGRRFKSYRGMGSLEAMQHGSKDRYFQDAEDDIKKLVPEGITGRVPYKGSLSEVIYQLTGGLRAGMGYCGAKNIKALQKARFIRITSSGMTESHPHDIFITSEAPNYTR